MSTTDTALVEGKGSRSSHDERATALGTGLLRLPDGTYLRPTASEISVRCLGPLSHWKVVNSFTVDGDPEGEGEPLLLYPLPPEAALQRFSIGEETLLPGSLKVAVVDALPEDAVRPVPPPELVEEFGKESLPVLSLQLGSWRESFTGGAEVKVEMEYASPLPTVDGRVRLCCPAAVSPSLSARGSTTVSLEVIIEDGNELVDEPTSDLELNRSEEDDSLVLTGSFEAADGDPVVTFRPGRTQMPVTRLRRNEEHFIFSIFPPTSIPASPQRRDLVFAVDASENLDAAAFERVKSDLTASLRSLDDNDRFALVTFGRDIDGYDGGEFCDVEQVEAAVAWLQEVKPQGRADVQPLLQRVQSLPSQEDRQLCVFLLAAGHVGNEPAILRSLDFDQSDRRYYTVGIGPSVKQSFLRRLALLTRGRCEVSPEGGCAEALERLLGQTRALLAEVTFEDLDSSPLDPDSFVPSRMTSLTPHGPVHCMGAGAPAAIRFRSKDETGVFFAGTVNAQTTDNPALGGVWAGLKVSELLDSVNLTTGAKKKTLKNEAAELAAAHGILTDDTVLVLDTESGLAVQYSAQPSCWSGEESKEKKTTVNSSRESSAPFDWRKGLVAREGLFKGPKTRGGNDSSESSGRYGLRSKGSSSETVGKPRLDRAVPVVPEVAEDDLEVDEALDSSFQEEALEDALPGEQVLSDEPPPVGDRLEVEPETQGEPSAEIASVEDPAIGGEAESEEAPAQESGSGLEESTPQPDPPQVAAPAAAQEAEQAAPGPPPVKPAGMPAPRPQPPVLRLSSDPWDEGRQRMQSYRNQLEVFDVELSLAALQGLPRDVSPGGKELPRILAQTVAHLEKRGFYSHAVSVLGLLMKDSPSPEVVKKMESLLVAWAESLPEEKLPEAVQIAALGRRVCPDSTALSEVSESLYSRWKALSGEQAVLPAVAPLTEGESPDLDRLLSRPQVNFVELQRQQSELARQMVELRGRVEERLAALPELLLGEMKQTVEQQLAAIPRMLERMVEQTVSASTATAALPQAEPVESSRDVVTEPPAVESPPERSEVPSIEAGASERAVDAPEAAAESEEVAGEESGEEMLLTREELVEMLLADPRGEESQRAVRVSLTEPRDRINFFRDLVKADKDEAYHSLSLARAYRESDQTKVAVVHYQKYLRANKDPVAYRELADAYDELGKASLAASARKAAEVYGGS